MKEKFNKYKPPFRPEGNVIVNNTENIEEAFDKKEYADSLEDAHPFSKIVNIRSNIYTKNTNETYPTIQFRTTLYYKEAHRLST